MVLPLPQRPLHLSALPGHGGQEARGAGTCQLARLHSALLSWQFYYPCTLRWGWGLAPVRINSVPWDQHSPFYGSRAVVTKTLLQVPTSSWYLNTGYQVPTWGDNSHSNLSANIILGTSFLPLTLTNKASACLMSEQAWIKISDRNNS